MKRTVFLAALVLACAGAAQAQPRSGITGTWEFTATLDPLPQCTIGGRATITPAGQPGVYSVHTTSHEICDAGQRWDSEQDCTARQEDHGLRIDCTLVHVSPSNYMADNFELTIVNSSLMRGRLRSSRLGQSVWRRTNALVS